MGSSRRRSGLSRPRHHTAMHAPRRAASTRLKRGYKATFVQKTALWTASGPLWRTNRRRSARASIHRSRTRAGSTEPSPTGRCDSKTCRLDVPRPTDGTNADVWSRTTDAARARGGGLGYARTRLGSGRGWGGRKPPFLLLGLAVWMVFPPCRRPVPVPLLTCSRIPSSPTNA